MAYVGYPLEIEFNNLLSFPETRRVRAVSNFCMRRAKFDASMLSRSRQSASVASGETKRRAGPPIRTRIAGFRVLRAIHYTTEDLTIQWHKKCIFVFRIEWNAKSVDVTPSVTLDNNIHIHVHAIMVHAH